MTKVKLRVTATSHSRDWNKQPYEARVKVGRDALRNPQDYKISKKLVIADLCKPTFYPLVKKSKKRVGLGFKVIQRNNLMPMGE